MIFMALGFFIGCVLLVFHEARKTALLEEQRAQIRRILIHSRQRSMNRPGEAMNIEQEVIAWRKIGLRMMEAYNSTDKNECCSKLLQLFFHVEDLLENRFHVNLEEKENP